VIVRCIILYTPCGHHCAEIQLVHQIGGAGAVVVVRFLHAHRGTVRFLPADAVTVKLVDPVPSDTIDLHSGV
jgi:hypothetical protein